MDPVLALLFAFIMGLMTGFSPCLLGSLVLLIAADGGSAVTGNGKYLPFIYGAGIITAYLIVAAGALLTGIGLLPDSGSRLLIYSAGGLTAIVVGLFQAGFLSLPDRLTRHTAPLVSRFRTRTGVFILGIIFAVLFAPCAIAPFLLMMGTLLIDRTLAPLLMLPAFALGVLAPYVLFAAFRSSAQEWLLKYAGIVQRTGGILLIGFGIWLLLSLRLQF